MSDSLISIERARELVLAHVSPLHSEAVPLDQIAGRVLAEPVEAGEQVPGFSNSAMDGFAVRADETQLAPATLEIVDEARAGHPAAGELGPGEAITISTGAPVPCGADAIVRVEDTERVEDTPERVRIEVGVEAGQNLRRAGEDIEIGDRLLAAGARLGAAEAGVLCSVGIPAVACARRPRVKVLATGDELVSADEPLFEGAVRNSNAATIPALARAAGAEVEVIDRVGDDAEATVAAIAEGLGSDLLAVCGGVSVGPHDHVKGALGQLGVERTFWGVSLKPGKPLFFGQGPEGVVFGLPGNPVSAFVTFILFARPALLAMQGADPSAVRIVAELASDYTKPTDRAHAVSCRIERSERGWLAHPAAQQGSHVLTSMVGVDGLAMIPAEAGRVEAGSRVEVELIGGSSVCST